MSSRKKKVKSSSSDDPSNFGGKCSKNYNIEDDSETYRTDEEKDAQKLDQEKAYLTDNNKFFPELIWAAVFEKIKKPESIESCSNASPYFRHLLKDKRETKVVLPKVFSILAKCYESLDTHDTNSPFRETNMNSIPWKRSQANDTNTYPMTGLLKCRLVCKSWNLAIQSMFENLPRYQFRLEINQQKEGLIMLNASDILLQGSRFTPQKFLQHFDPTHYNESGGKPKKNPFLGRCVHLRYNRNRDDFEAHLNVLQKYGSEIWYFRVMCYDDVEGPQMQLANFYRELQQICELMPNLKVLYISLAGRLGRGGHNGVSIPRNWPTPNELQALEQAISENPFVKLPNLKYLSTEYIPTLIFNEIIAKNGQITQLEVRRQNFHGGHLIFSENLSNLRELSLEVCTLSDLKKFENCSVPLKLKRLHFYYIDPAPFVPWSRIFTAIESKLDVNSCTELFLLMPIPKRELDKKLVLGESLGYRLNLPKLKFFTIFDDTPFCLDFLLSTKNSLEEIVIRKKEKGNNIRRASRSANQQQENPEEYTDFEERQTIKFLGLKENMKSSNILTELPRLKKFTYLKPGESGGCILCEYGTYQVQISRIRL